MGMHGADLVFEKKSSSTFGIRLNKGIGREVSMNLLENQAIPQFSLVRYASKVHADHSN